MDRKGYNPCGDLTGRERELCDESAANYFNLPFAEVMRAVSIKAIAELEHEEHFRNVDALKHWADYNLSDEERRASLNFETFTPLQAGLAKYLVHVLYENRYNIHYNALVDYCRTLDAKAFRADLTEAQLSQRVDELAQAANHSTTVNTLLAELWHFISA